MTVEYQFTSDWFGRHAPIWQEHVVSKLPLDKPVQWLELGSWEGRSAVWTVNNVIYPRKGSLITCVDHYGTLDADKRFDHNTQEMRDVLYKVKAFTQFFLCQQNARCMRKHYDVIYVDADHNAKAVLMDAINAWPLLKTGGYMIFDDYMLDHSESDEIKKLVSQPKRAIDVFLDLWQCDLEVLHKEWQVIIKKIT